MTNAVLQSAKSLNGTGAALLMDFHEPAYRETVTAGASFKLDSIVPIEPGSPARLVVREAATDEVVMAVPFAYCESFTLPEIAKRARDFLPRERSRHLDRSYVLKPGNYKVVVLASAGDKVVKTRNHLFTVGEPPAQVGTRAYCIYAYKDLVLREGGSMPCCNLVRDEKLLYSTYAEGGYDPWNNEAWKSLRRSLKEGNPKYCHPTCPQLTLKPLTREEFYQSSQALDGTKNRDSAAEDERYRAYLDGDVEIKVGPSRLGIMVGTICNIDCIFCPIPFLKNRRTVFTENMLQLLEKHVSTCRRITFTGGEPLVYIKELRRLEKYFHPDLTVQIVTNGIAADHLINYGGPAHLALRVSINCANRDDYIYLHEKDFFDRIVSNIRQLKAQRPSSYVSLKFIIMKRTMPDIVNFARLCIDLGVDDCTYTPLWIKTQSVINPLEKILPTDAEWEQADGLLREAKDLLESHGLKFCWSGWDTRPDDYQQKIRQLPAEGSDGFAWADA